MKDRPIFLLGPMSRMGSAFAPGIIKACPNVVAAIDDIEFCDSIFGVPRWSSSQLYQQIENHPDAMAIDFSVSKAGRHWASTFCEKAGIERLDFEFAYSRLNLPPYAPNKPLSIYSPWLNDAEFLSIMREIADSTLVDHFRLWELWRLVQDTRHVSGSILEVGVWRGGSAALMAAKMGKGDIYLCDTFAGVVKAGPFDSYYVGGEHADASQEQVEALMKKLAPGVTTHILKGIFPEETGAKIKSEKFRLVHIDVDVYQSARDILEFVWPRLSSGGCIVYDDYGFDFCPGIARHVDEQQGTLDALTVYNLNGHAMLIKR